MKKLQPEVLLEVETAADKLGRIRDEDLVDILLEARKVIGYSEDDWTVDNEYRVREMIVRDFGEDFSSLDPSLIAPRFILVRKNKKARKRQEERSAKERLSRIANDFERVKSHDHSAEYLKHLASDKWTAIAAEHKKRCNFKCQGCDSSEPLECHHTKEGYRHLGDERPWHIIALCKECHRVFDMLRSGWVH